MISLYKAILNFLFTLELDSPLQLKLLVFPFQKLELLSQKCVWIKMNTEPKKVESLTPLPLQQNVCIKLVGSILILDTKSLERSEKTSYSMKTV